MRFVPALVLLGLASCTGKTSDGSSGSTTAGEGQRCTHVDDRDAHDNGNSECLDPLICYAAFNTGLYPYDRCCPVDLTDPSNVPACHSACTSCLDGSASQ
jgi:hypothetical protein